MSEDSVVPKHVGLILDGNRRWAKEQGLPTLEGHRSGYKKLKDIAQYAFDHGVDYISAYVFSTENWKRSKEEVQYLLDLALWVATKEIKKVHKENIRVLFLGSRENLSEKLSRAIDDAEELTKDNTHGTLAFCFNYGGQQEIVSAVNKLLQDVNYPKTISEQDIAGALYAPEIPPIDLVIRSSGEQRLSNFMLWRASYAELYFTDVYWPAFTTNDFDTALTDFAQRKRRFGS